MIQLLLIAVSLALDAMAVSVSVGIANPRAALKQGLRMGLWFGAFQFGMPLLGFLLGRTLSVYVEAVAPFVAFALLAFVGGRMVLDSLQNKDCQLPEAAAPATGKGSGVLRRRERGAPKTSIASFSRRSLSRLEREKT